MESIIIVCADMNLNTVLRILHSIGFVVTLY